MSAARWDGAVAAMGLGPAVFLAVRLASRAMVREPDPRVMLNLERSPAPGHYLVALFGVALLATATTALARRRGWRSERVARVCFAVGAASAALGAAVVR
ncbi:MAG: hypothetical protein R3A48_29390 [Polyangiales bacterium]